MKQKHVGNQKVVSVLLLVALLLTLATPAFAEGGPTPNKTDPFPDLPKYNDAESLVKELNEYFANEGVAFYLLQSDGQQYHFPEEAALPDQVFETDELIFFDEPMDIIRAVDNLVSATNQVDMDEIATDTDELTRTEEMDVNEEDQKDVMQFSWHTRRVSWYSFACGREAWFMGGVFCWRNILYKYRIRNRRVTSPRIISTYLTGTNILRWKQIHTSAYMINRRAVRLQAWGIYILGVSINGVPIGVRWNGRWTRTDRPPCFRCR